MKLAYLLNTYPVTSTTFIRREIEALEALGQPVSRFAVRHWQVALVEPGDTAEQQRTEYLLTGRLPALLMTALTEPFLNLRRLFKTLPVWWTVYRAAGDGLIRHLGYLLQAILFCRITRHRGIEHVHVHFSTNPTTVAMLAQSLGGASYSFTVHGPDELVDSVSNALSLKVGHAAFVVAISDYCRNRIQREAPAHDAKVTIIRCGLELSEYRSSPASPNGSTRVVCVGRLCANKGQVLIPAAVAAIRDEFPDVVIELIGDGEDRAKIEAEVRRHGVEANVRLLGWMPSAAVRQHLADAVALLLPSLAEGLPIVLMEAFALERPVLTTPVAGIPELVDGSCGWLFPPGEAQPIAEALRAALSMPVEERVRLGREGRRRIEASHDVMHSARTLLQMFGATVHAASDP